MDPALSFRLLDPALYGKRALVTGASRGIGKAIAEQLVQAGVVVVGTSTSPSGADAINAAFAAIRPHGREAVIEHARLASRGEVLDVGNGQGCEDLVAQLTREGGVHILVNNAGITRDNLSVRMKDEDWHLVLDTNLSACFRLSRAVLRGMMKARWGRIINITSVVGETGNAGQANYAAAKAGLAGMSRALAREVGSRNITVNCIAPGYIETDMTAALGAPEREALSARIPLQRLGRPEDVAAAVVFLASQAGGYLTGETLQINGGMFMG